jgi:hypothetical protein
MEENLNLIEKTFKNILGVLLLPLMILYQIGYFTTHKSEFHPIDQLYHVLLIMTLIGFTIGLNKKRIIICIIKIKKAINYTMHLLKNIKGKKMNSDKSTLKPFFDSLSIIFVVHISVLIGYWAYLPEDDIITSRYFQNYILISLTVVFLFLIIQKLIKDKDICLLDIICIPCVYILAFFTAGYSFYTTWLGDTSHMYPNTYSIQFTAYMFARISSLLFLIWILYHTINNIIKMLKE